MRQNATWYGGRPQPRELCVRWGPSSPFLKRTLSPGAPPPIFDQCLLWPNGWMDQDGTWHGGRPWSSPYCARWEYRLPPQKGGIAPNFRQIFIVTKRLDASRWSLGMEVGLSPGDFVLDGEPAPTPKGTEPHPIFGPRLLWPNGCMDQDTTWYGGRPRPTRHRVRCGCSYPQKKGHTHPTQFVAYVCCGQMAGWMKTPLGTEVDLDPGHIVLDGVPAPAKGHSSPLFSAHVYCGHGRPS